MKEVKIGESLFLAGVVTTKITVGYSSENMRGEKVVQEMKVPLEWESGMVGAIAVFPTREEAEAYTEKNGGGEVTRLYVEDVTIGRGKND